MRGAIVLLAGLAFTASANAAPAWAFGDAATAAGPIVTHLYGVGTNHYGATVVVRV